MKKILILEANPKNDLSLNDEIRDLQSVIESSRDREEFKVDIGLSVRSIDLQGLMHRYEPNIVHFCGHGEGQNGLVFLDKKIDTDTISSLFTLCREHLQCVVLNACYSEVQAIEINQYIKYVIGMNQAIRDDAAIAFSTGFYRALGYGKSFEDAFEWGKNAIQLALTDGSIDRRNRAKVEIAEKMRKLIPIGEVSEANIKEHLKPIFKVNLDIISFQPKAISDSSKMLQTKVLKKKKELLSKQYLAISESEIKALDPENKVILEEKAAGVLRQIQDIDNQLNNLQK